MAVPPIVKLFIAGGVHLGVVVGPALLSLLESHLAEGRPILGKHSVMSTASSAGGSSALSSLSAAGVYSP